MKTDKKKNQKPKESEDKTEIASGENLKGELNAPLWSVVSFENLVASNLTYDEAAKKIKQLKTKKIAGLCIITDEAASRISEK